MGKGTRKNRRQRVVLPIALDAIYTTEETDYTPIPKSVGVARLLDLKIPANTLLGRVAIIYSTTGTCTAGMQLKNITDGAIITGSEKALAAGTGKYEISAQVEITDCKTYQVEVKKIGGGAGDELKVESIQIILDA